MPDGDTAHESWTSSSSRRGSCPLPYLPVAWCNVTEAAWCNGPPSFLHHQTDLQPQMPSSLQPLASCCNTGSPGVRGSQLQCNFLKDVSRGKAVDGALGRFHFPIFGRLADIL